MAGSSFHGYVLSGLSRESVYVFLCHNKKTAVSDSRSDSYLEAQQEAAPCLLSDTRGAAEHHEARRYVRVRFICEAKQQREPFTTAVFKQLGSKMCL